MAVLSDDMGGITAYAAAVNRGYTGTKEEFEQLMYSYTEVAERAEAAAGNAHESEENSIEAKDIAVSAKNEAVSARDAAVSARDASISAKNDSQSARDAAISAKDDTLAAKDAVMSAKSSVDETSANFSDEVTAAISDVNAAGRNQKELAKTHAIDSEAWAVGQREGADVGVSDTTYHNNSKYYAEQSALAKSETETARDTAITAKNDAVSAKNQAETAKGDAQDIVDDINAKSEQIDQNAEDISALQTAISTKAEVDGNYENLTAGTAEQLVSTVFIEDNAPYHFRTSGGSADIGDREYDQIVGGSLILNQLIKKHDDYTFEIGSGGGLVITVDADGYINITGTASEISLIALKPYPTSIEANHVAVLLCDGYNGFQWGRSGFSYITLPCFINKHNARFSAGARINVMEGDVCNIHARFMAFDLTLMLGSTIADYVYSLETTTAGAGGTWLKSHFPRIFDSGYVPYNAGTLEHVSGLSAHKMTGFNQWDEEWEVGTINSGNGQNVVASDRIRSKNYTHIINSMPYYVCLPDSVFNGSQLYVALYDADKNFVRASLFNTANGFLGRILFSYFLRRASYLRFWFGVEYGTTYKGDVCLNLHWDGERDGEYEPYEEHSYPLDSDVTLRGIPKLDANNNLYYDGDEYLSDGTVERKYGVVDLGTLNWTYFNIEGHKRFGAPLSSKPASRNLICAKYQDVGYSAVFNNTAEGISIHTDGEQVAVYDTAYTDAADFKTAMSGVYLVYELATPTTEQAQPFTNPQIVDDFGTEEYVTNSIVPVGHVTKYANNLRAKLEMAPNSPDGDGDYIVRQTNGLNEYVSLSSSEVIQNINEAISDNAEQIDTKADVTDMLKAFPTDTVTGAVASFSDGAELPLKSLIVNIDPVQSGSGDPSPTNVRPISGWNEVNVGVSGKNLFDSNFSDYTKPYDYYIKPIKLEFGKRYIVNAELVGTAVTGTVFGIAKKGYRYTEFSSYNVVSISGDVYSFEFTVDDTFTSPKLVTYVSGQAKFDEVMSNYNITLAVKTDQNTYEPYSGQSITIQLGQTVYGGKLDVLSGELVIDRVCTTVVNDSGWNRLSSEPYSFYRARSFAVPGIKYPFDANTRLPISNIYQYLKSGTMVNGTFRISDALYVVDERYSTVAEFKDNVLANGLQIYYELAEPLTIQLDPHEVTALLGSNNIWADSGDSAVEYRADPTLYIQRKIAEALANTSEG